jgi:diaminohydroxyphosphoribosylaminopyrimidine deaminase/5-amino-6-(5-phosphoribosylamino)uracil reductase
VLADDPQLTARLPGVRLPRQPLRVIVDSRLRTPPEAQAVRLAAGRPAEQPLLIATTEQADKEREAALRRPGVEVLRLPATEEGRVDLKALGGALAERQIISVLAEGGAELHAGLLAARQAQRALFFIAPRLAGGKDAPTPVGGDGVERMADAIRLGAFQIRRFRQDIALQAEIRL